MRQAICKRCRKYAWVNTATKGTRRTDGGMMYDILGEFCADCFDKVEHDPAPRNRSAGNSGPNHNDPAFDNVIRALEEDR